MKKASEQILHEVEHALDAEYASAALPHHNRHVAAWYFTLVHDDYVRNLLAGSLQQDEPDGLWAYSIDRLKYSLKFGLARIWKESQDQSIEGLPRRVEPSRYERAAALLFAGRDYIDAHQLCGAAHAGTLQLVHDGDVVRVERDENEHDKRYGAAEMMGHSIPDSVPHISLFYAWSRGLVTRPGIVNDIADSTRRHKQLLVYDYEQGLALRLAEEMHGQEHLIPEGWQFRWGGRHETALLLNALAVRALYHLVAIHFAAKARRLRGMGHENLCLILSTAELALDLRIMTSVSEDTISSFVTFLTYGVDTSQPDPALQPLLPVGKDLLCVPCVHYLSLNHERNLLALQARIERARFDSLSHLFEKQMLKGLADACPPRWGHRLNVRPLGSSGEELDMLIWDASSKTVLICEAKWMLQPGEPREVREKKDACRGKVGQLRRKVDWARQSLLDVLPGAGVDSSWHIEGVVVIETFAGVLSQDPNLPVMPTAVFVLGLQRADSLRGLVEWAKSLAWLPAEEKDFSISGYTLTAGALVIKGEAIETLRSRQSYFERLQSTIA